MAIKTDSTWLEADEVARLLQITPAVLRCWARCRGGRFRPGKVKHLDGNRATGRILFHPKEVQRVLNDEV